MDMLCLWCGVRIARNAKCATLKNNSIKKQPKRGFVRNTSVGQSQTISVPTEKGKVMGMERYRSAKVYMTVNIDVLVNDGMTKEEQEQKMVDLAIDYVQCLGDTDVQFELAEFND